MLSSRPWLLWLRPTRRGVLALLLGLLVGMGLWLWLPSRPRLTLAGHKTGDQLIFSPDARHLALVTSQDKQMRRLQIWDLTTGLERPLPSFLLAGEYESVVAFSPDGTRVAGLVSSERIMVWDLQTGTEQETMAYVPGDGILFSAAGRLLTVPLRPELHFSGIHAAKNLLTQGVRIHNLDFNDGRGFIFADKTYCRFQLTTFAL